MQKLNKKKLSLIAEGERELLGEIKQSLSALVRSQNVILAVSNSQLANNGNEVRRNFITDAEQAAWSLAHRNVRISIQVVGKNGFYFSNDVTPEIAWEELSEEPWWINFLGTADNTALLLPTSIKRVNATYAYEFQMILPIRSIIERETLGAVIYSISEKVLYDVYDSAIEEGPEIILCTSNGQVISGYNKNYIGLDLEDVLAAYDRNNQGSAANLSRPRKLSQGITIKGTDWHVYNLASEREAETAIQAYFESYLKLSIPVLLVMILVVYLVTFGLTKPIRQLSEDILKVKDGDYSVRTKVFNKDEIGLIANNFNEMSSSLEKMIEHRTDQERVRSQLELSMLRAQINPHFIYNSLNSIRFLIEMEKTEEATRMLLLFTKLLRHTLTESEEYISLDKELLYLEDYLEFQKIRYPEEFAYCVKVPELCRNCLIPGFILQPLVENSIMHGMQQGEKLMITIEAKQEGDYLYINVRDNGRGIEAKTLDQIQKEGLGSHSIGLQNVRDRIRIYCSEGSRLSVESQPGEGTLVILKLDLLEDK
ncbi:MAG: sensor histidine kinase [Eubacteriales bacterium]|nr:sensor histidine kinase [Eubacteriales bacterium]